MWMKMCEMECTVAVLVLLLFSHTFVQENDEGICCFCVYEQCHQFQCHNMTLMFKH